MIQFLLSFVALFLTANSHASTIQMYENKAPLNLTPVERVVVRGPEVFVRSAIHPCSSYPGFPDKIYGDVYECYTSREKLRAFLNDTNVLMLSDEDLSKYLIAINHTFSCENRSTPGLVPYFGKNVYWFSGILTATTFGK